MCDTMTLCVSSLSSSSDALCFFKQKTAYEMRISDWSSDVCSSDLLRACAAHGRVRPAASRARNVPPHAAPRRPQAPPQHAGPVHGLGGVSAWPEEPPASRRARPCRRAAHPLAPCPAFVSRAAKPWSSRSEEHTSELQSLMRHSSAVFCLKQKI